ncbi:MAG: MATE family efflux transporter [Lachnospiraceae bacterium]|nr:MATE family efflux transporter [Lachnospiraceae bacterium]
MTHGPLAGKILLFALPLLTTSVLQQLFNAADIAVVGRFADPKAMAAVGSNASVINLLVNFFVGLSVGANVVIANLIGAGRRDKIHDAVHTVISVSLITGIISTVVGITVAEPVLTLMGAPKEIMRLALLYLRIYCTAGPFIMLYNFGSAILRSKGDSRKPLISLFLSGIINVFLNLLLVIVFHLHVIGVAVATVVSNIIGAGLILYFLMHEEGEFRLSLRELSIKPAYLKGMIKIGLPAGLQGMVFSLSNVVIQSTINSFGANAIAGSTAAQNLEFMSYCVVNAFAQATVTFTSQNYGAGDWKRCDRVFRLSMLMGIGVDLCWIAVYLIFRVPFMHLFTTDEEVLRFALIRILHPGATHFLITSYEVSGGAMRGLNRSLVPALISIFGTCAFRMFWVFTVVRKYHTFAVLMDVYPASWIFTGIVMLTAYFLVRKKVYAKLR